MIFPEWLGWWPVGQMLLSRLAHHLFHKGVKGWLFGQQAEANLPGA